VRPTLTALIGIVLMIGRVAKAQEEFPQTQRWGSGLIDIPVAWVSPLTGDFGLTLSRQSYETSPAVPEFTRQWSSQAALDIAFLHVAEVGISAYSPDPEQGLFGQLLLLNQDDFQSGIWRILPSVAVGIRNVGPYHHIDRFGMGYLLGHNPGTGSAPVLVVDSLHRNFDTGNSLYGVMTKSVSLGSLRPAWLDVGLSFTVGYGNGLFSNHGTIPVSEYAANRTGGLFYGVKADFRASSNTLLSLLVENNAWDYNVGASLDYRGLRAGVAITELGAGSAHFTPGNSATALYNYKKFTFSLGWQNNILALVRGDFLANRAARLRKERDQLLAEIGRREARIAELQAEIRRYEAQNLLELEQRRAQAEQELEAESERLKRLQDRVKRIEGETQHPQSQEQPPSGQPPSGQPPSAEPPATPPAPATPPPPAATPPQATTPPAGYNAAGYKAAGYNAAGYNASIIRE
jgi:hypothetical protein